MLVSLSGWGWQAWSWICNLYFFLQFSVFSWSLVVQQNGFHASLWNCFSHFQYCCQSYSPCPSLSPILLTKGINYLCVHNIPLWSVSLTHFYSPHDTYIYYSLFLPFATKVPLPEPTIFMLINFPASCIIMPVISFSFALIHFPLYSIICRYFGCWMYCSILCPEETCRSLKIRGKMFVIWCSGHHNFPLTMLSRSWDHHLSGSKEGGGKSHHMRFITFISN